MLWVLTHRLQQGPTARKAWCLIGSLLTLRSSSTQCLYCAKLCFNLPAMHNMAMHNTGVVLYDSDLFVLPGLGYYVA